MTSGRGVRQVEVNLQTSGALLRCLKAQVTLKVKYTVFSTESGAESRPELLLYVCMSY